MACAQVLDDVVLIPIASDVFNLVNFLIFDVVLASSVFALTGDIAGLVNSISALSKTGNRLTPFNPPFVGVGLTCTRKNIYRLLAVTRAVVMVAVLATNFLIEGRTCEIVKRRELTVLGPGYIDPKVRQAIVRRYALRRRGCMGRNGDEVYYGELRVNHSCELRPKLMRKAPLSFGLKFFNITVNPPTNCVFHKTRRGEPGDHIHSFRCPGFGIVACLIHKNGKDTRADLCDGVVLINNVGHFCEGKALFPGRENQSRADNRIARCRIARGVNTSDHTWVPLRYTHARTLRDTMDAVYGADEKNITVRIASQDYVKDAAEIKYAYFWIIGAVSFLIFILSFIDIMFRARGLIPTAHNELGIGSLLKQTSSQVPPHSYEEDSYIGEKSEVIRAMGRSELYIQNDNGVLRTRMSNA